MPILLTQSQADAVAPDFAGAVAAHQSALEAHRLTVGVPAPSAHALIEMASDQGWEILPEPEPEESAPEPEPEPDI